jgi:lipopolysaccharide transport system permease protein
VTEALAVTHRPLTRIETRAGWTRHDLRELWEYRELLGFLVWRDIKVRYKQTALGVAWAVLQPLVPMVLYSVIFGRVAKLPSEGLPYPLFALTGLLPWQLFASALGLASNSLVGSAGLITKVYFPRIIIPVAAVCGSLVDFAVSLVLVVILMAWYGVAPGPAVVALPLLVVFALATALGVALWTSALNVKYRDVQYVLPFLLQAWLLASPVAYSMTLIDSPRWRMLYGLNPMAGVVQGFRWALIGADAPGAPALASVAVTVLLLVTGLRYFRGTEDTFADVI